MERQIEKARLLLDQEKYSQAEELLKDLLTQYPTNLDSLILLIEVYLQQKRFGQAEELINNTIGIFPEEAILFYQKARLFAEQSNYNEAESCLKQSLTLDPSAAHTFALWAAIKFNRKHYTNALKFANKALELDPENLFALNTRSSTLLKLNKAEESFTTIEGALREDPNNAYTHANYGWNLLQTRQYKKALIHFKEALHIEPTFDYAKEGMIEALKAKNRIYSLFLGYSFWLSKRTKGGQWAIIIGSYIAFRLLKELIVRNDVLAYYLMPVFVLLAIFMISTWVISPLSNLLFRLHPYGKHLLNRKEIISSNFVGISLLVSLSGVLMYVGTQELKWVPVAIFGFAMILPLGIMLSPSKYRYLLVIYTAVMALFGVLSIVNSFVTTQLINTFTVLFLSGFFIFQWIANAILIQEDNQ
jgi:tetratricopeptide (TPR) repeat protein